MANQYILGGCAAFGHSCYGGHGKRSQGVEMVPADAEITDTELSRNALRDQDSTLPEQFSRIYDVLQTPDNNIKTLLQKLAKSYEDERLQKKYMNKLFNY